MSSNRCFVCGSVAGFEPVGQNLREARCRGCRRASRRNSDVAKTLIARFEDTPGSGTRLRDIWPRLQPLRIYAAEAGGPIHDLLAHLPGYVCSEFFPGVPPGQQRNGVRCEDLMRLSFRSDTFDLVITQEVLEHVADPWQAFREIRRVLKSGGLHLFTVPYHPTQKTQTRAIAEAPAVRHVLPPVLHGDPLRREGVLVFTDFGVDLLDRLQELGFATTMREATVWYGPEEITWLTEGSGYEAFQRQLRERPDVLPFRYNSIVFESRAHKMAFTGERFTPEVRGEIAYEHLHRYAAVLSLATGKDVLDIASGEGYGSVLLAREAASVLGVDVSAEAVEFARARYGHVGNVRFEVGRCEQIPAERGSVDLVVSFETLEHLTDHDAFLGEVRRVLRPGGLLVISSPNKRTYSDEPGCRNRYHERELYEEEFVALMRRHFAKVRMYGQRLTFSSCVWSMDGEPDEAFRHYSGTSQGEMGSGQPPFSSLYLLAVCSDNEDDERSLGASLFTDAGNDLYFEYLRRGAVIRSWIEQSRQPSRS